LWLKGGQTTPRKASKGLCQVHPDVGRSTCFESDRRQIEKSHGCDTGVNRARGSVGSLRRGVGASETAGGETPKSVTSPTPDLNQIALDVTETTQRNVDAALGAGKIDLGPGDIENVDPNGEVLSLKISDYPGSGVKTAVAFLQVVADAVGAHRDDLKAISLRSHH
jgi:hypothetical protein